MPRASRSFPISDVPGPCTACVREGRRSCKFGFFSKLERLLTEIIISADDLNETDERHLLNDHHRANETRGRWARKRGCEFIK